VDGYRDAMDAPKRRALLAELEDVKAGIVGIGNMQDSEVDDEHVVSALLTKALIGVAVLSTAVMELLEAGLED
jgi:hypothetical protein